jgi:uncharacterized protein with von Willebrand factor type A (vWA) domain
MARSAHSWIDSVIAHLHAAVANRHRMELELTQAENFILSVTDSQARIDLKRFANEIRSAANDSIELNKIRDRLDGWGSRRTQ